jgi:pimeloyl-ACP methyl ester carboxylesterase
LSAIEEGAVVPSQLRVPVGDAEITLTLWHGGENADLSVVLVPGWGGGPSDQLGIGAALSRRGVDVAVLSPRGWHNSSGTASFSRALDDIGAAVGWARKSLGESVVLGGHSWGGGMSLAFAARDPSVRRVFSISGTDHGLFIRQCQSDRDYAAAIRETLEASAAPSGSIRFDVQDTLGELAAGQAIYGLQENAGALSDRSILLVGGWEDSSVTVDGTLLPLYRALRRAGADDVSFRVYHADHSFSTVRATLHEEILTWLMHQDEAGC